MHQNWTSELSAKTSDQHINTSDLGAKTLEISAKCQSFRWTNQPIYEVYLIKMDLLLYWNFHDAEEIIFLHKGSDTLNAFSPIQWKLAG